MPLSVFTDLKLARNAQMRIANSSITLADEYTQTHQNYNNNKNTVKIKGNPSLAEVQVMMLGIRYKDQNAVLSPKSAEIWVNELRLSDIDNDGGWATAGQISMKLADLGNVVISASHRTAGFGSIDQNTSERSTANLSAYDISANMQLGKLLPEKTDIQIPMYIGISKSIETPEYDQLNTDLKLKQSLDAATTKAQRDSIKQNSQDYDKRSSITFSNVKVNKVAKEGETRFYDPANFSISFSQNKYEGRDQAISNNKEKITNFAFNYNYNKTPKIYEPFKNKINSPLFKIVKDFNFMLEPTILAYRMELYRYYNETQFKNFSGSQQQIPVQVEKDFLWRNNFDLSYMLTKNLKLDFSSQGINRIDEPDGVLNRSHDDYAMKKDSIMKNLWRMGRPVLYQHNINIAYQLPINKIQLLNWTNITARYQAIYDWNAGAITDATNSLGNTIDNIRTLQFNGQFSLSNLYNKIPYLKETNQRFSPRAQNARVANSNNTNVASQKVSYSVTDISIIANKPVEIKHNLAAQNIRVRLYDSEGNIMRVISKNIDENTISIMSRTNIKSAQIDVMGDKVINKTFLGELASYSTRIAMMLRSANISYSNTAGTILPGFMPSPSFFGGGNYSSEVGLGNVVMSYAPGIPFLLGFQDKNFAVKAADKAWLSTDTTLNSPFIMTNRETLTYRLNLEPINSLKIELTGNHLISKSINE